MKTVNPFAAEPCIRRIGALQQNKADARRITAEMQKRGPGSLHIESQSLRELSQPGQLNIC